MGLPRSVSLRISLVFWGARGLLVLPLLNFADMW